MHTIYFPFSEYWWFYLLFTAGIVALLAMDLRLHRKQGVMSIRQAALWTAGWVALALGFAAGLYAFSTASFGAAAAKQLTLEFLAGYAVEESLSIDNMFVFALIFRYLAVPLALQRRVLFYGVLGAIVFRGLFIAGGAALIRFHWVLILFGVFLIYTGIRLFLEKEREVRPDQNPFVRLVRRVIPVTQDLYGERFLVRQNGRLMFTPLMIAVLAVESTDILFAVDSVPAAFGVTHEALLIYTSNIFAILGLRALYFLLAGVMDRFRMLQYGIALVLVFVGVKMTALDPLWGGRFPVGISLAIIVAIIGAAIGLSLLVPSKPAPAATPGQER